MALAEKIVRDSFTERLLNVMTALIAKDALGFKKDYAQALDVRLTTLYQIERGDRNYPSDESKRALATLALKEKYYVNPAYLSASSNTVFFREPETAKRAARSGTVSKITSAREVKEMREKIIELENRVKELEGVLMMAAEDPVAYAKQIKKTLKHSK